MQGNFPIPQLSIIFRTLCKSNHDGPHLLSWITTAWFCCVWVCSWVHGASAAHVSACPWLTGGDGTPPALHGSAGWMLPPPLRSTLLRRARKNYTWCIRSDHKSYNNNSAFTRREHYKTFTYKQTQNLHRTNSNLTFYTCRTQKGRNRPKRNTSALFVRFPNEYFPSFLPNLLIFPPNSQLTPSCDSLRPKRVKANTCFLRDTWSQPHLSKLQPILHYGASALFCIHSLIQKPRIGNFTGLTGKRVF